MTFPDLSPFATYAEWRLHGEDQECAALRTGASPEEASSYETQLRQHQEGSKAA